MNPGALTRLVPRRRRARIEIVPLIDVIFFLLATFVLFTLSLDRVRVIEVELPDSVDRKHETTSLILRVATGGTVVWEDDPMPVAELPARLANYKQAEKTPRIMITSEPGVTYGEAMAVFDQVRHAKGIPVTFDTRQPGKNR